MADLLNFQPLEFIGITVRVAHIVLLIVVGWLFRLMYQEVKKGEISEKINRKF